MGEREKGELSIAVAASLRDDHITNAVAVISDVGIDRAITSGALDGVPIIGALTGLFRAGKEISGHLFLRQVVRFLKGVEELSRAERNAYADKVFAGGEAERFGEALLLLVQKSDEIDKPKLMARAFVAHVRGQFDYPTFLRLSLLINRCVFADLHRLREFRDGVQDDPEAAERLFVAGFLTSGGFDGGGANQEEQPGGTVYYLSGSGRLLAPLV